MSQWRAVRKAYTDKKERERRKRASLGSNESTDIEYSGVLDERLCPLMTDVEMSPILIGHTFPTKEVLLIRIAEEANFCGCQIAIQRSDNFKIHSHGMDGSSFSIQATYSTSSGWKVTSCLTREVANADDNNIAQDGDADQACANNDEAFDENHDSDEEGGADSSKKGIQDRTPLKARWLVPLVLREIAEKPNVSNADLRNVLSDYIKPRFITSAILQNARSMAREQIFGDPAHNVFFANALFAKIKECGHDVEVVIKDRYKVMRMWEYVILSDLLRQNKADGRSMKKAENIAFVEKWKVDSHEALSDGGLIGTEEGVPLKFLSGNLFSPSVARITVPFLHQVFQADACHMSSGKYTFYSCYSTTANCNTSPVAFGILFGNEDKEGWNQFWKFTKNIHPSINATNVTIITDQAKGLIESISDVPYRPGVKNHDRIAVPRVFGVVLLF